MGSYTLEVEHIVFATPERVFQVWLDGNDRRGPWVGTGDRVIDPRVGGKFEWYDQDFYDMGGGGGCWGHWGEFTKIENSKLPYVIEYTWMSPDWTDEQTTVVHVELDKSPYDNDHTRVRLSQSNLPDNYHGWEHKNAWIRILGEMSARFLGNAGEKDRTATGERWWGKKN